MGTRWKGKCLEAKTFEDPTSKIVSNLQFYLVQSEAHALLSGCSALLAVETVQTDLLNGACFGQLVVTAEKDKQWFKLGMEEAFYLNHSLKCLKIIGEGNSPKTVAEVWLYMKAKKETFPVFYKAIHIFERTIGLSQYGVDFVAYCHHPSLVHSEFAVLVLSEDNDKTRTARWSPEQYREDQSVAENGIK